EAFSRMDFDPIGGKSVKYRHLCCRRLFPLHSYHSLNGLYSALFSEPAGSMIKLGKHIVRRSNPTYADSLAGERRQRASLIDSERQQPSLFYTGRAPHPTLLSPRLPLPAKPGSGGGRGAGRVYQTVGESSALATGEKQQIYHLVLSHRREFMSRFTQTENSRPAGRWDAANRRTRTDGRNDDPSSGAENARKRDRGAS